MFVVELLEKLLTFQIPGRGKPLDIEFPTVAVDFLIFRQAEFETFLLLAGGGAPRAFARRVQYGCRIDDNRASAFSGRSSRHTPTTAHSVTLTVWRSD